jgi:hypothetical protein
MSVSLIYSAIPPSSTLYIRLQREKSLAILVVSLFSYGNGLFNFFEIDSEEIDSIFEDIIRQHQETFISKLETHRLIDELRSELMRTREAYPGIENRTAMLENSSAEIEKKLLQELSRKKVSNAAVVVEKLMFGDKILAPNILLKEESLGLISRDIVTEGARLLENIDPETVFPKNEFPDEWCLDHLKMWRDLYILADEKNEEILVEVT